MTETRARMHLQGDILFKSALLVTLYLIKFKLRFLSSIIRKQLLYILINVFTYPCFMKVKVVPLQEDVQGGGGGGGAGVVYSFLNSELEGG